MFSKGLWKHFYDTSSVRDISGYKLYFYDISGFKPHMYTCAWCESDGIHNFHHWGFRAELWTLFDEKDIDFLPQTHKERNSLLWYSAAMNYKLDSDILAIDSQKKTGKVSLISYNSTSSFPCLENILTVFMTSLVRISLATVLITCKIFACSLLDLLNLYSIVGPAFLLMQVHLVCPWVLHNGQMTVLVSCTVTQAFRMRDIGKHWLLSINKTFISVWHKEINWIS